MMKVTPLGEVAHVNMGSAPPGVSYNEVGKGVPMIAGAGDYGEKCPEPKKYTTAPSRMTEIGDLIVCIRATIGDLNWADKKYCLGRGVAGIRPKNEKLDIKYLAHYINAKKSDLSRLGTGSTFLAIRRADLENFPIPLPPLSEQKRIAAILDKADAIRDKRKAAIKLADEFLRAVFLDMFGDPVTNPKGWEVYLIRDLGKVITGSTPSSQKDGMFGDKIPFVTPGDLESDSDAKRYVTEEGAKNSRTIREGATFVCCIGATIGKVDRAQSFCAFNQQINAIDWKDSVVDTYGYWAMRFLKSVVIKNAITTTLPILKKSIFETIEIPLPPLDLQKKFERAFFKCLNGIHLEKTALEQSELLFQSLTQRAFRGEL